VRTEKIAVLIAIIAISLIGIRPKNVPAWVWAGAGVIALLGLGLESLRLAFEAVLTQWNVLLFILGLMGISAAAEYSGLFEWIASALLERASGSRKLLFVNLFIAGSVMTIFFSNDATAIVFTPIIFRTVAKRGIDALPYLYACTFVADTASFGLPFSNPTNLLVLPRPNFIPFLLHLGPPMLISLVINLAVFLLMFRTRLRGHYVVEPARAIERRQRYTLAAMVAVAAAYVVALALRWPLGPVAVIGALFVLVAGKVYPREASQRIGWSTFPLLAGLFVLLDAVSRSGFTTWAISGLHRMAHEGPLATILAAAFWSALAANLFNNLPIAVISGTVVSHGSESWLAYPLIAGVDLGPNLTTTGSLATILWLSILRSRGLTINPLEYLRLGLTVVPAMLIVTSLWLWLTG